MADESCAMNFGFKPEANGTVVLILSTPTGQELRLVIPVKQIAGFTAAALNGAQRASRLSNMSPEESSSINASLPGAQPDRWGVALGPKAEQIALVAHYGAASLVLPFAIDQAAEIGGALMAAGVKERAGH